MVQVGLNDVYINMGANKGSKKLLKTTLWPPVS